MTPSEIHFSQSFVTHLPRLVRLLCTAAGAPEQNILQGVGRLKSLEDLHNFLLEILEGGTRKQQHWLLEPLVIRDSADEAILVGFRVYVACLRKNVCFSITLEKRVLSVESGCFVVSADPGGKSGLSVEAPDTLKNYPPKIKQVLRAVMGSDAFKATRDGAAAAEIISRLCRENGSRQIAHGVAGNICQALDILEAVRGVSAGASCHLGNRWQKEFADASPEMQAIFLTHDLAEIAPDIAVELYSSQRYPSWTKAVSFILPLGGQDMAELLVEEMGISLDFAGLYFELPDSAEGDVLALHGLDEDTRKGVTRLLKAITPLTVGAASSLRRKAMLFMSSLPELQKNQA